MTHFFVTNFKSIICSFTLLFSINAQSTDYFFEVGSALSPVSLGNAKDKQIELITERISPLYPSFTTEFEHSDFNNSVPNNISFGIKNQRLEFKFTYFNFNKAKSSLTTNYTSIYYAGNNQIGQGIDENSAARTNTSRSISVRSYSINYIAPITSNFSWKPIVGILDWSITDKYKTLTTGQFGSSNNAESDKSSSLNFFYGLELSYSINDIFSLNLNINRYKFGSKIIPFEGISLRTNF